MGIWSEVIFVDLFRVLLCDWLELTCVDVVRAGSIGVVMLCKRSQFHAVGGVRFQFTITELIVVFLRAVTTVQ